MEVDWIAQNTPVHFQINLVENHWHKMQIFGFIISRIGITYKSSQKPDFWDLALPTSILLTSHLLPQQHSTAIISHPCCPLNGVSQLLVLLCSVASSSLNMLTDWLFTIWDQPNQWPVTIHAIPRKLGYEPLVCPQVPSTIQLGQVSSIKLFFFLIINIIIC